MIGKSLLFSVVFLSFDLLIYFILSTIMTLFLRDLPFIEASISGALLFISRIIYCQAFTQFLLLAFVRYYDMHANIFVVAMTCILSFLIPSLYFLKESSGFLNYFTFSIASKDVGPGIILIASVTLAWLIMFKFTNISKSIS